MRKVILMMSVFLDGFFEVPRGQLGWHLVDDDLHRHFNEDSGANRRLAGRTGHLTAERWPDPGCAGKTSRGIRSTMH